MKLYDLTSQMEKIIQVEKSNICIEKVSELDMVTHGNQVESIDYELIDFRNIKIEKD